MTFEKKESSPCVVSLTIKADAEEVQGSYKSVFNMFLKNGVIPGFRKGKVPAAIIKQKFAKEITDECQQACFREFYPKAVEEAKLDSLGLQNVTDVLFTPETGFSCTALVEVRPTFSLPKYKKLSIKKEEVAITDEDVTKNVEGFRAAFAKFVDATAENAVTDGDYVQIDYKGTLDDKAILDTSDESDEDMGVRPVVPDGGAVFRRCRYGDKTIHLWYGKKPQGVFEDCDFDLRADWLLSHGKPDYVFRRCRIRLNGHHLIDQKVFDSGVFTFEDCEIDRPEDIAAGCASKIVIR